MEKLQLIKTIDALSRVVSISENQKQELINKYENVTDSEVIKELCFTAYRVIGSNLELYDYALTVIRNINPSICPPVEEMKSIITKIFSMKLKETCY